MKRIILIVVTVAMTTALVSSCGSASDKKAETPATEQKSDVYMCPMKCEDKKSDKPGKCEVCGMELEKVTQS